MHVERIEGVNVEAKLETLVQREHLVERHVGLPVVGALEGHESVRMHTGGTRAVGGGDRRPVVERDAHVVVAKVGRARGVVDRREIRLVVRGQTLNTARRIDQVWGDIAVEPQVALTANAAAAVRDLLLSSCKPRAGWISPQLVSVTWKACETTCAREGELKAADERVDETVRIAEVALALA